MARTREACPYPFADASRCVVLQSDHRPKAAAGPYFLGWGGVGKQPVGTGTDGIGDPAIDHGVQRELPIPPTVTVLMRCRIAGDRLYLRDVRRNHIDGERRPYVPRTGACDTTRCGDREGRRERLHERPIVHSPVVLPDASSAPVRQRIVRTMQALEHRMTALEAPAGIHRTPRDRDVSALDDAALAGHATLFVLVPRHRSTDRPVRTHRSYANVEEHAPIIERSRYLR